MKESATENRIRRVLDQVIIVQNVVVSKRERASNDAAYHKVVHKKHRGELRVSREVPKVHRRGVDQFFLDKKDDEGNNLLSER